MANRFHNVSPINSAIRNNIATLPNGHILNTFSLPTACFNQYPVGEDVIPKSIVVLHK